MDNTLLQRPGVTILEIVGVDPDGLPLVQLDSGTEACPSSVVYMPEPPDWSECVGLRVVAVFEDGDETKPIVLGLLDAPPEVASETRPRTLRMESEKELIIECGKSKIALRADGRIEIRGGHLISRSSGANKIKGSSVELN